MSKTSDKSSSAACPICGKSSQDRYRPFCSARCADVDLNRWLGGVYAIPSEDGPANENQDED